MELKTGNPLEKHSVCQDPAFVTEELRNYFSDLTGLPGLVHHGDKRDQVVQSRCSDRGANSKYSVPRTH